MRDIVFTGMFMAMALLALRYAHLGMMLWVWSALFPPNDFLFGFAQNLPFNKVCVVCTIVGLISDKKRSVGIDVLLFYLLAFLGEVSLSYAMSSTPPEWGGTLYDRLTKVVVAALFIHFTATDRLRLHSVMLAACLAIGAGVVDEAAKFVVSAGIHHVKGPPSWGDENITATIILMAMPLMLYLYKYSANRMVRSGTAFVFFMSVLAVIGTYSRGGFLGLVVYGLISMTTAKRRVSTIVVLLVVGVLAYQFVPDSWFSRIHSTTNAEQDGSFMGRVVQWKILTLMALEHPLLGGGMLANMVPSIWMSYAARLGSELTFISTPAPTIPYASHSIYFQVLGENGFTGLLLFLVIFLVAFRCISEIKTAAVKNPDLAWAGDLAAAVRTSFVLFLVTGAALPIPYLEFPYVLLGIVSALRNILQGEVRRASLAKRRSQGVSGVGAAGTGGAASIP